MNVLISENSMYWCNYVVLNHNKRLNLSIKNYLVKCIDRLHNDFALSCFVFSECENKIYEVNPSVSLCVSTLSVTCLASSHWSRLWSLCSCWWDDRPLHSSLSFNTSSLHSSLPRCRPSGHEWYNRIPLDTLPIKNYPNLLTVTVFISVTAFFSMPQSDFLFSSIISSSFLELKISSIGKVFKKVC